MLPRLSGSGLMWETKVTWLASASPARNRSERRVIVAVALPSGSALRRAMGLLLSSLLTRRLGGRAVQDEAPAVENLMKSLRGPALGLAAPAFWSRCVLGNAVSIPAERSQDRVRLSHPF